MPIRLTTPEAKEVARDTAIQSFRLLVPHKLNGQGDLVIDRDGIRLVAHINTFSTTGAEMGSETMVIPIAEVPAARRDMLKNIYAWLEGQAITRGFSGPGTPDDLNP